MKVAAIQHDIVWEDAESTRKRLVPLIAQAAAADARLIAVTEMYATGFSMHPERIAEQPGGPNELFLVDQAREHGAWLAGSIAQWEPNGRARNVAVLAGPDGTVHRYAKIHPFGYSGEDQHYEAGTEFLTVDVEGLRTSVFVCYDLRFADEFWALAPETDCYVVPASWPRQRAAHWKALLPARAIENQAYVVGVNRVGTGEGLTYVGDSVVLDPLGEVVAVAGDGECVIMGDVDPARVREVRERYPFLRDRR
jgi:omega-amidase